MSIFATVAIVCTMSACNDYVVDQAKTFGDGVKNTVVIDSGLDEAMQDEKKMNNWLVKYKIEETVFEIVSIEIETHELHEGLIP